MDMYNNNGIVVAPSLDMMSFLSPEFQNNMDQKILSFTESDIEKVRHFMCWLIEHKLLKTIEL